MIALFLNSDVSYDGHGFYPIMYPKEKSISIYCDAFSSISGYWTP